jgi:hypothetical protein
VEENSTFEQNFAYFDDGEEESKVGKLAGREIRDAGKGRAEA